MGDLLNSLPTYFGLSGVRGFKERGVYFYDSVKIHKTKCNPSEIIKCFNLLERIEQSGFNYADKIIPAAQGTPYLNLGHDIFIMTRNINGHEPDMCSFADMVLILESLANFHFAARNFNNMDIPVEPPLTEIYEKQISMFNTIVKQLSRRPRLTDFDVIVLKNAASYVERAEEAAKILKASDYIYLYENAVCGNHVCHNALKEETFTITQNNCYISGFENATIGLQLTDLASVLQRYARKSLRETPIINLIEIYDKILPIHDSKILYAMLLFPWSFFKIVSQYYSKKRVFIPAAITTRITRVLEEQQEYDAYININASPLIS